MDDNLVKLIEQCESARYEGDSVDTSDIVAYIENNDNIIMDMVYLEEEQSIDVDNFEEICDDKLLKALIDYDVEFVNDSDDEYYDNPLGRFIFNKGSEELVMYALDNIADVHKPNGIDGWYPIHHICANYSCEYILSIFNKIPNWSIRSRDSCYEGVQPIHILAQYGKLDVIKKLNELGFDMTGVGYDSEDYVGANLLHIAAMYRHDDIVEYLLDNIGLIYGTNGCDGRDGHGFRAIHYICKHGSANNLRKIIEKGAKLYDPNDKNMTIQQCIAEYTSEDKEEKLDILIRNGMNLDIDVQGKSTIKTEF